MAASPSSLLLPLGVSSKTSCTIHSSILSERVRGVIIRCSNGSFGVKASMASRYGDGVDLLASRREMIGLVLGVPSIFVYSSNAKAAGLPPEDKPRLCDDECSKELENVPMVTTQSGLQYKDIKVGGGPSPPVGFQVIQGLDEGILSMKVGGKRRLYIPGSLAFPKGLTSAPGRPRVAPKSPVVFDVSLEYIPGLEADEE